MLSNRRQNASSLYIVSYFRAFQLYLCQLAALQVQHVSQNLRVPINKRGVLKKCNVLLDAGFETTSFG